MLLSILIPLILVIAGVTAYSLFVFRFYHLLVRRDLFTLSPEKYNDSAHPLLFKTIHIVVYVSLYLILYPVIVFSWFVVIAALLYVVSSNRPIETIMLTAMGVVGAIRICCYYSEALATDVAKVVPLGLLSFMLINNTLKIGDVQGSFEYATFLVRNFDNTLRWEVLGHYLVAIIIIEFGLRMTTKVFQALKNRTS